MLKTYLSNIVVLVMLFLWVGSVSGADFYVSPSKTSCCGAEDGTSEANAFWGLADLDDGTDGDGWRDGNPSGVAAGDTIYLMDGSHTGDSSSTSALYPPTGLNGTSGNVITIQAQNDGGAIIDGEGDRNPVFVRGSSYYDFIGFNAKNSGGGSSGSVVTTSSAHYINFKRIIAWESAGEDVNSGNNMVFTTGGGSSSYSTNILFEDCAGFKRGRKIFQLYRCDDCTMRRCFGRFEGMSATQDGPMMATSFKYYVSNALVENCIMTWDQAYSVNADDRFGCYAGSAIDSGYAKIYGSMCYFLDANDVSDASYGLYNSTPDDEGLDVKDFLFYTDSADTTHRGVWLNTDTADALEVNNVTVIGSQNVDSGAGNCKVSSNVLGDASNVLSLNAAVGFEACSNFDYSAVYNNTSDCEYGVVGDISNGVTSCDFMTDMVALDGNIMRPDLVPCVDDEGEGGTYIGAKIDKRYVDGVLTDDDLFPWPMNQRIIDAMTDASVTTVIDVTNEVYTLGGGSVPSGASQPKYYVSNSGDDSSLGTSEAYPWKTLAYATDNSGTGSVYLNRGDTFAETFSITADGTADLWLTFGAYGSGDKPIMDASGDTYGVDVQDANYVIVENLTVVDAQTHGVQVWTWDQNSTGVIVRDLTVTDSIQHGIVAFSGNGTTYSGVQIYDNTIATSGGSGIVATAQITNIIANPQIHDNTINTSGTYGIQLIGLLEGGDVYGNILTGNGIIGIGSGIGLMNDTNTVEVSRNSITNQTGDCIFLGSTSSTGSRLHYNICDNPSSSGIKIDQAHNNVEMYNNVLNSVAASSIELGTTTKVTGIIIKNNIVDNSGSNNVNILNASTVTSNYNCWDEEEGFNSAGTRDFTYWQGTLGHDANGYSQDPPFEGVSDYRLQSTSNLVDTGTNVGLTLDFDGNSVPVRFEVDIGAYELQGYNPPTREPTSGRGNYLSDDFDLAGQRINKARPTPGEYETPFHIFYKEEEE